MIVRGQRQLIAQAGHFCLLRGREILIRRGKQGAGIEQLFVEKLGIKGVAEIVMGGNIFPRLLAMVTAHPVA
ncbi:hypothetical protein D3C81_2022610 [compost metagenome]